MNVILKLIIYLFIKQDQNPATTGLARINAKEREKKDRKGRRAKKRKGIEKQRIYLEEKRKVIYIFVKYVL